MEHNWGRAASFYMAYSAYDDDTRMVPVNNGRRNSPWSLKASCQIPRHYVQYRGLFCRLEESKLPTRSGKGKEKLWTCSTALRKLVTEAFTVTSPARGPLEFYFLITFHPKKKEGTLVLVPVVCFQSLSFIEALSPGQILAGAARKIKFIQV